MVWLCGQPPRPPGNRGNVGMHLGRNRQRIDIFRADQERLMVCYLLRESVWRKTVRGRFKGHVESAGTLLSPVPKRKRSRLINYRYRADRERATSIKRAREAWSQGGGGSAHGVGAVGAREYFGKLRLEWTAGTNSMTEVFRRDQDSFFLVQQTLRVNGYPWLIEERRVERRLEEDWDGEFACCWEVVEMGKENILRHEDLNDDMVVGCGSWRTCGEFEVIRDQASWKPERERNRPLKHSPGVISRHRKNRDQDCRESKPEKRSSTAIQVRGNTRHPGENQSGSDIFRHDCHMRKSGSDPAGNRTRLSHVWVASALTADPARPLAGSLGAGRRPTPRDNSYVLDGGFLLRRAAPRVVRGLGLTSGLCTIGCSRAGMKGPKKQEIPEIIRRSAASSGTIPTCENPELTGRELSPFRIVGRQCISVEQGGATVTRWARVWDVQGPSHDDPHYLAVKDTTNETHHFQEVSHFGEALLAEFLEKGHSSQVGDLVPGALLHDLLEHSAVQNPHQRLRRR
ncbi:hypothetical protein PR048_009444 [Dryococelus australis]|uniref:Uncharacterized protein n=1 Tax=Dryococelus australis TaxID=614101 RepID=A0ABQ9I007_9NEOP|nr:hypothetical protein PR048_009444 [Dryococelus australis]